MNLTLQIRLSVGALLLLPSLASAQIAPEQATPAQGFGPNGSYPTAQAWYRSTQFQQSNLRCGTDSKRTLLQNTAHQASVPSDCSLWSTNPDPSYSPGNQPVVEIMVVFHVITRTNGTGYVSDTRIDEQIEILNEDFRALAGTPGSPGVDTHLQFRMADVDPSGNPTNGITRHANDTWYNDGGNYGSALNWDPSRYCNVYTNSASGYLGYTYLPQGNPSDAQDGIVMFWETIGRDSPIGAPYDQGRTLTHEMGHFLGLYHTFDGGCGSTSSCNSSGDLICDTNRNSNPNYGCGSPSSCGTPDPKDNYMNYTDDTCMDKFTEEQARRMICTIINYRPNIFAPAGPPEPGTQYCFGVPNSTGSTSTCSATGTFDAASNDLVIVASPVPNGSLGYFICSKVQGVTAFPGGSQGILCVGGNLGRITAQAALAGPAETISVAVDGGALAQSGGSVSAVVGDVWNFQLWHRDLNPGQTSNFSTGYSVLFQ